MEETELQVVCKSCGSEVSPYVTECPYCGARLRKRAPRLERTGEGLEAKPTRRARLKGLKRGLKPNLPGYSDRPWASLLLVIVPAVMLITGTLLERSEIEMGALEVPAAAEWWRFITAPFVYGDAGLLFAIGLVTLLFGPGLEQRLGSLPTLILLVACGALGLLGAFAIDDQRGVVSVLAGGNGLALGAVAAWWVTGRNDGTGGEVDRIPLVIAAVAIVLLPLFASGVSLWAAPIGGAVGALAGLAGRRGSQ
jgi:membrane associated rhomboid family serine protease